MMPSYEEEIRQRLIALQDKGYREFAIKLIPTAAPETIIGVRTPALRALSKEYARTPAAEAFLQSLPHRYHEENLLHGFLLETIRDYEAAMAAVEAYLPNIDNWATCDQLSLKVVKKHLPDFFGRIRDWLSSDRPYTVRFAMGMLMRYFLDEHFSPEIPEMVATVRSEEYYVNMMIAWFFATALVKQPEAIIPYFQEGRLDTWTHNKAIQKAVESYRVRDELKAYLRTLRRK